MLGSMLKYAAILAVGAIGFSCAGQYMDAELIDHVKRQIAIQEEVHASLSEDERREKIQNFIKVNRNDWEQSLTFASNLRDLEEILAAWF